MPWRPPPPIAYRAARFSSVPHAHRADTLSIRPTYWDIYSSVSGGGDDNGGGGGSAWWGGEIDGRQSPYSNLENSRPFKKITLMKTV